MKARFAVPGKVVPAGGLMTPGGEQGLPGAPGSITNLSAVISSDANNTLTEGTDNLLFVPPGGAGGGGHGVYTVTGTWDEVGSYAMLRAPVSSEVPPDGTELFVTAPASISADGLQAQIDSGIAGVADINRPIVDTTGTNLTAVKFKGFSGSQTYGFVYDEPTLRWTLFSVPTPFLIAQNETQAQTLSASNPTMLVFYPEPP